jgi:hypothetical protein
VPSPPKQTDSANREIPTEYVGKLEPNYYCRGWNAKRQHYCRSRAGSKTDHAGTGRCSFHGGTKPVIHGRYRRYANILTNRVRELLDEHAEDPNPLDLRPELDAARALLQDFIERTADDAHPGGLAEAIKLVERVARIVEGIERVRSQNALTPADLSRLMLNMGLVVRQFVTDDETCKRIQDGWLALRV